MLDTLPAVEKSTPKHITQKNQNIIEPHVKRLLHSIKQDDSVDDIESKLITAITYFKKSIGKRSIFKNNENRSRLKSDFMSTVVFRLRSEQIHNTGLSVRINSLPFIFTGITHDVATHIHNCLNAQPIQKEKHLQPEPISYIPLQYLKIPSNIMTKTTNNGIDITMIPSRLHPTEIHDRGESFLVNNTQIMLVCDGVSNCNGQCTGENAAKHISIQLRDTLTEHKALHESLYQLEYFLNKQPSCLNEKTESKTIKSKLTKIITTLEAILLDEINEIRKGISPIVSATTLELCFILPTTPKRTILTFSLGDSQTLVYHPSTQTIDQLNASIYPPQKTNTKRFYLLKDLDKTNIPLRDIRNPGTVITGSKNHPILPQHLSISIATLEDEDSVLVVSDGITDAFTKNNTKPCWDKKSEYLLTRLNQAELGEFISNYSGSHLAKDLAIEAYRRTPKPDDITVVYLPKKDS